MSGLERLLSTFALNAAWQLVVVAAAALAADRLLRRSSVRTRHAVWRGALGLGLLLPLLVLVPGPVPAGRASAVLPGVPSLQESAGRSGPGGTPSAAWRVTIPVAATAGAAAALLLLLSTAWRALTVARALRQAARWRADSRPSGSGLLDRLARECERSLGLGRIPLHILGELDGPITVGARRPVVILPAGFEETHDEDSLRAAIGHELSHVKRRDFAWSLLHEAMLLPLWWHPAARLVRRRVDETREMACDEMAAGLELGSRRYARSLVRVAAGAGRRALSPALGVNDAGILEERVRHLLRPRGGRDGRRWPAAAGAALLVIAGLLASVAVVEAEPLQAASAAGRFQMKHVLGSALVALALSAADDPLATGLEELKKGNLPAASANVEKAIAARPGDRDAHYTLGVVRWTEVYRAVEAARKTGGLGPADRERLARSTASGHAALGKALAIDPTYQNAVLYDSLLYRLDADLAADPAEAKRFVEMADLLLKKAKEMKGSAGSAPPPPPPPPPPAK